MENFQNIKLNLNMNGKLYYSSQFKELLFKELDKFSNNLAKVAKEKYGRKSFIANFFCNFKKIVNAFEDTYKELKGKEKKAKSNIDTILNIRKTYAQKYIDQYLKCMINMLTYASEGDLVGVKLYAWGRQTIPQGMTKEDLAPLKQDTDYTNAIENWVDNIAALDNLIYNQGKNLILPFPKHKVNKNVLLKKPLWSNACKKEFIKLFKSLLGGTKAINNKYSDIKTLLTKCINQSKSNILQVYKSYNPPELKLKYKLSHYKDEKDKVIKQITKKRLEFLDALRNVLTAFQKVLTLNGYNKYYPFVLFLKELRKKCKSDYKKLEENLKQLS